MAALVFHSCGSGEDTPLHAGMGAQQSALTKLDSSMLVCRRVATLNPEPRSDNFSMRAVLNPRSEASVTKGNTGHVGKAQGTMQGLGFSLPTPRLASIETKTSNTRIRPLVTSIGSPEHPCPNHNSVRVPVSAITRASMPKPCNAILALQYAEFCALVPSRRPLCSIIYNWLLAGNAGI